MKLKNKKTGEIREARIAGEHLQLWSTDLEKWYDYDNLDYLAKWWERYEEPKGCWIINILGIVEYTHFRNKDEAEMLTEIGNRFETKEEAEKAVEKLKAWTRLEDKGFRITLHGCKGNAWLEANWGNLQGDYSDVLLLFGGEE